MITRERFIAAMREVVEEAGEEYVAPWRPTGPGADASCRYVHNGEPDCIMGRVLAKLGVTVEWLQEHEDMDIMSLLRELGVTDGAFLGYANVAQAGQDNAYAWGVVYRKLRDRLLA